jgi:pSer/pThr/pTyr-binding forkhead associated (FHA) protein
MSKFRLRYLDHEVLVGTAEFVIGRLPGCDLILCGAHVSRQHARLCVDAAGLTIEDLGSRNGVQVNARAIEGTTRLSHGDVVSIGLDALTVMDDAIVEPVRCVSTLLPGPLPPGESDVDGADVITIHVQLERLSKREREVFDLIALGHTHREIAKKLFVSIKTIETHRTRIGEKLGCRNLREIMHSAFIGGVLGTRAGG